MKEMHHCELLTPSISSHAYSIQTSTSFRLGIKDSVIPFTSRVLHRAPQVQQNFYSCLIWSLVINKSHKLPFNESSLTRTNPLDIIYIVWCFARGTFSLCLNSIESCVTSLTHHKKKKKNSILSFPYYICTANTLGYIRWNLNMMLHLSYQFLEIWWKKSIQWQKKKTEIKIKKTLHSDNGG